MDPRIVTKGDGPQSFFLFVPIYFADIHKFQGFESGTISLPGKTVSVQQIEDSLILQIREFETVYEAKACFGAIHAAVLRAVASRRVSASVAPLGEIERRHGPFPDGFQREVYAPWPPRKPETDGVIWRAFSYVLPDHERILLAPTAWGKLIRPVSPAALTDWFRSNSTPQTWPLPKKAELALAIAAEANARRNPKLEFLGLVNALEVLIENTGLTEIQEQLTSRWKSEIDEMMAKCGAESGANPDDELREIRHRLNFINSSIKSGLRRIFEGVPAAEVLDPAVNVGFKAVHDLRRAVSQIYDIRSELTHTGYVRDKGGVDGRMRLHDAASVTRYLVYCVLADRLK